MKNLKKRVFTHKSKSKIFITILCIFGLLFSWSCSCKNRVSDPNETPINGGITNKKPDETPPGTFSMSASTDNVVTSIVKESGIVGDIKISFVSANKYDYTMDYTVEDSETDEAKKLTKADFQLANKVLTAKDSVATKVRLIDSSAGPVEKPITINFTFKANDASLKNNTQTLSVEVKLTHAQKIDDKNSDVIQSILQKGNKVDRVESDPKGDKSYTFEFSAGTFNFADNTFTIENKDTDNLDIPYSKVYDYTDYNFSNILKPHGLSGTRKVAGELGDSDKSFTLTYDVTFDDKYETTINQIKVKFVNKSSSISFKDDTQTPTAK